VRVGYDPSLQYKIAKEKKQKKEISEAYCLALIALVPGEN